MARRDVAAGLLALVLAGAARSADERAPEPAPPAGAEATAPAEAPPRASGTGGARSEVGVTSEAAGGSEATRASAAEGVDRLNGFEITRQVVDRDDILPGGPARDAIRSIESPRFAAADAADWVRPDNPVLGVRVGEDARAYPVHLIERHQIVNDTIGGRAVAVTYDPLTGAPIAFERVVDGRTLSFGVSGLVYNSGFLMYDRETESLWSQFEARALSGPLAGRTLTRLRVRQEDFASWLRRHPRTRVLERPDPGLDYRYSPYEAYWVEDRAPYPVKARDRRFHAKELVLGIVKDGRARAYLGSLLTERGGFVEDEFRGRRIEIDYSTDLGVFRFEAPDDVEVTEAYWFAWKAFHPQTEIWRDPGKVEGREP